ncbi:aminopeptidase [Candidatus Kaiserbacteria bacterium]|nr:aminopeptidase [Candidatus Kaiserbacteria bacterium]
MSYTPSKDILEKYADVLVNFALGGGKGIKKGEVVRVTTTESAKPLFVALHQAIVKAGGHMVSDYHLDDDAGMQRTFFELAQNHQIDFFPAKYMRALVDHIDHSVYIAASNDPHALNGVDPKKIMRRGEAIKPYRDWRTEKEHKGKFTWTIALYGTEAMAQEARLTSEEYWDQIIKACFLDEKDPIRKWKDVYRALESYRRKLNTLSPKIDRLHVAGPDADLWIQLGDKRVWLGGSGRNIPSFELFTSPDRRGTEGWLRVNQPLFRYGNKVEGIELHFKGGKVIKSSAKTNENLLKEMIKTPGANMVGEFSLTDTRFSRITRFMAETLFDENMGGPEGNTHIALGASYKECYSGDVSKMTKAQAEKLGYNDSSVHTDVVSTAPRTVTAHLHDGKTKVIYTKGQFVL